MNRSILLLLSATLVSISPAQPPSAARWIWGASSPGGNRPEGEICCFRAAFELAAVPPKVRLVATADNHFTLWINGHQVARGDDWKDATVVDAARYLSTG